MLGNLYSSFKDEDTLDWFTLINWADSIEVKAKKPKQFAIL